MTLTLEVTGAQAAKLGSARRKTFKDGGGTIGRLRDNDWPLPDQYQYVSNRHAVIRFDSGTFYLEDTSTNGVFVNGDKPENRLVKGQRYALKEGDWIFIEPYEIRASIEADATAAPTRQSPDDPYAVSSGPAFPVPSPPPAAPPVLQIPEEENWFDKLGPDSSPAKRQGRSAQELHGGSVQNEHFRPPDVVPLPVPSGGELIPTGWDDSGAFKRSPLPVSPADNPRPSPLDPAPRRDQEESRPSPRPSGQKSQGSERAEDDPPARPNPGRGSRPTTSPEPHPAADVLADVLRGAGIDPSAVPPEFAQDFGRILRLVVGGVMDVLQARQRIKEEFRLPVTLFRPADNNPLKFSANVDDALHNLLVKRNKAYLQPVDAFEDAFDDIRNHQMAMLAGMRVAFEAMLAQFDPALLQEEFDRHKRGSLISVPAKLRYWDLYGAKFHDMVRDPDAAFRELFGDDFAVAYEDQLKRLKSRSRDNEQ